MACGDALLCVDHVRSARSRSVLVTLGRLVRPLGAAASLEGAPSSTGPAKVRSDLWSMLPKIKVGKLYVNLWGVLFGIQCWSLMFFWLAGMLAFLPFKLLLGDRFDEEGLVIDGLGRWWSRLTTFPHSLPRLTGRKNIPWGEPCVYVANHASWLDIPYMGGYLPALKFVGKKELTKIPILGQSIVWGQHIVVDRKSMAKRTEVLDISIERLKRGCSIALFPEGTRSQLPDGEMLPFSKGAFLIAQQAGVRIVPVSLSHTGEVMPCDALLPVRPAFLLPRIHVHPPISTGDKTLKELQKEVRAVIQSEIEPAVFSNTASK